MFTPICPIKNINPIKLHHNVKSNNYSVTTTNVSW